MKVYVMTYNGEPPRVFESRIDCAFAVAELLKEEEAERLLTCNKIESTIVRDCRNGEESIFIVSWEYDLIVRVYCVELEKEF